jgi:hypothetical protein
MERALTPYVAYLIMPVFALFNAGVVIADSQALWSPRFRSAPSSGCSSASRSGSWALPGWR